MARFKPVDNMSRLLVQYAHPIFLNLPASIKSLILSTPSPLPTMPSASPAMKQPSDSVSIQPLVLSAKDEICVTTTPSALSLKYPSAIKTSIFKPLKQIHIPEHPFPTYDLLTNHAITSVTMHPLFKHYQTALPSPALSVPPPPSPHQPVSPLPTPHPPQPSKGPAKPSISLILPRKVMKSTLPPTLVGKSFSRPTFYQTAPGLPASKDTDDNGTGESTTSFSDV